MSQSIAAVSGVRVTGGTTQTVLGGSVAVRLIDDAYVVIRNRGAATAFIHFLFSSDNGGNFYEIPDPLFGGIGIDPGVSPPPWVCPPPNARGDLLKITASSVDALLDVEVYNGSLIHSFDGSRKV